MPIPSSLVELLSVQLSSVYLLFFTSLARTRCCCWEREREREREREECEWLRERCCFFVFVILCNISFTSTTFVTISLARHFIDTEVYLLISFIFARVQYSLEESHKLSSSFFQIIFRISLKPQLPVFQHRFLSDRTNTNARKKIQGESNCFFMRKKKKEEDQLAP